MRIGDDCSLQFVGSPDLFGRPFKKGVVSVGLLDSQLGAVLLTSFPSDWQEIRLTDHIRRSQLSLIQQFELLGSKLLDAVEQIEGGQIVDGDADGFLDRRRDFGRHGATWSKTGIKVERNPFGIFPLV